IINGKINGSLSGFDYIYLHYGNNKDSTLIKNNTFSFYGKVKNIISADLVIPPVSSIDEPFYIENTKININIDVSKKKYNTAEVNFIKVTSLTGTKTKLIQNDFENFSTKYSKSPDWNNKLLLKLGEFIKNNPDHPYGPDLLSKY